MSPGLRCSFCAALPKPSVWTICSYIFQVKYQLALAVHDSISPFIRLALQLSLHLFHLALQLVSTTTKLRGAVKVNEDRLSIPNKELCQLLSQCLIPRAWSFDNALQETSRSPGVAWWKSVTRLVMNPMTRPSSIKWPKNVGPILESRIQPYLYLGSTG